MFLFITLWSLLWIVSLIGGSPVPSYEQSVTAAVEDSNLEAQILQQLFDFVGTDGAVAGVSETDQLRRKIRSVPIVVREVVIWDSEKTQIKYDHRSKQACRMFDDTGVMECFSVRRMCLASDPECRQPGYSLVTVQFHMNERN